MMRFTKGKFVIEIKLAAPGVYIFPNASSSGKTYLCGLLSDLSPYERVDSLTFNDVRKTNSAEFFNPSVVDLVMLDRYDMYPGRFVQEISKFAESGIVLVDSKTYDFPFQVESCGIYLYENRLVVM